MVLDMTADSPEPPKPWDKQLAERIGINLKKAREKKGSAQWLADRTKDLKFPIGRATISELETGRRKTISVAELLVLAYALDTSPVMLLYGDDLADGVIEEFPGITTRADQALLWHIGDDESSLVPAASFDEYLRNNYRAALAIARNATLTFLKHGRPGQLQDHYLDELRNTNERMRAIGMKVNDGDDQ